MAFGDVVEAAHADGDSKYVATSASIAGDAPRIPCDRRDKPREGCAFQSAPITGGSRELGTRLIELRHHAQEIEGDREIDASVEIDGRRESTPTTTLRTPHSLSSVVGRWGQSERGRFPIAHTMQQSEDLVLHVKLASIDASVDEVTSQLSKKDAIPEPPLWERLLKGAALLALNAVTAGFGAGVASKLTSLGEGSKEAVKVFIEGSSAGIIEGAVSRGMAEATNDPSSRRTPGGTLLSPDIFFGMTQREALRDAMLDHLNRVNSSLTYDASRLDREHPGAGYRVAVAAHDAITDQYALAFEMQFAQSLQAWCTFSAQARLGTGDPNRGRDSGTELATQVDVKKILPGDRGRPATHLDKTPGVLRLELAEIAPKHLVVVRSFIDGFDNDAAVEKLSRKIIDLRIPMVARFNERKDKLVPRGFVISRNENGAVLADSTGGLMQEMFGGRSDHEAARLVFEHQIAHQPLTPARG